MRTSRTSWADGQWQPTNGNANPEVRGFQISQLYSFTVTPGELAVAHFRGFGDEFAAKEFHNSKLGLPFIGKEARITDGMIDDAIRDYTTETDRPKFGGRLITAGLDQGYRNTRSFASGCRPAKARRMTCPRPTTASCYGTASFRTKRCGPGSRS